MEKFEWKPRKPKYSIGDTFLIKGALDMTIVGIVQEHTYGAVYLVDIAAQPADAKPVEMLCHTFDMLIGDREPNYSDTLNGSGGRLCNDR